MSRIPLTHYLRLRWRGPRRDIPLFQYWHDGNPPEEVATLIAGWKTAPGFEHRLFDHGSALAFIERHAGDRVARCFRSCAVPAMQSDLFRYVALFCRGGVYLDADNATGPESLARFLGHVPTGLLCRRRGSDPTDVWFINDICFARKPGNALFGQVVELACRNIEAREPANVWEATGPWLLNSLRDTPDGQLFEGFTFAWYEDMAPYVRPIGKLAYKKGPDDWRRYAKEGRSIYA